MKLLDSILISLAVVLFIIGVHQTFYFGIAASYWLFMLSLFLVFYIKIIKSEKKKTESKPESKTGLARKTKSRKVK